MNSGEQVCAISYGDGGGGGYGGGGGGGGGGSLIGVVIPVPLHEDSFMNLGATKIKTSKFPKSEEVEVKIAVVAAAQAAGHSNKPQWSLCTVYYANGDSEVWVKFAMSGTFQWGPLALNPIP